MRSLTSALALGCVLFAGPVRVVAQSQPPRSASFDTRYTFDTYSNQALADFGIELLDLAALPAETITLDGSGGSLLRGVVLLVATDFAARAYKLSYHEFGHGTRAAAAGFRPHFGYGTPKTNAEIDEAFASGALHTTFWGYFLGSFFRGSGFTFLPAEEVLFAPPFDNEVDASRWDLLFNAGGLNNEMFFTEHLEERIRRGGGHVGMLSSWIRGKVSTARYGDGKRIGDVGGILDWYRGMGFDIEREALLHGSTMSLLLSVTSYELVYRLVRSLKGDPIRYDPWTPYGIELPNTGFYMTTAGISLRVSTGYRRGALRFPVAVEHVYNGRKRTELTLGAEWGAAPLQLGTRLTIGKRVGVGAFANRTFADRILVSAGYALYDSRNLYGERMIPSLESGPRYHDFFVRLGIVY